MGGDAGSTWASPAAWDVRGRVVGTEGGRSSDGGGLDLALLLRRSGGQGHVLSFFL